MDTKKPHIETLQMTIGMAMAEEDSPQNIEIPLEIKLPNGQTMYPACVLGGLPFHGQQQIAERIAAAWNAFTGIATTEIHAHAPSAGGMEPRKTDTAARGTDAQIIKERELCAYAFAGAVADGLSGGTGPDTQESEWLRPAFEAWQEIAQLRAEIDQLRKRECLHKIAEPDHFRGATQMVPPDHQALTDTQMHKEFAALRERIFDARIGRACSCCEGGTYQADNNGYSQFHRCNKCHYVPMWGEDGREFGATAAPKGGAHGQPT